MSGKLKKNFFMKPNNSFKFFVNFFTQLKIYIFPIYYRILNKKKISIYFEKKIQPRCFDIREKILFNKLRNMSGKLKKNFSWSRITYLNFLWNFFTQLKIYIFPIYYRILNKKKTFYIFRKKNPAAMLRYSRKIFVQQSLFKIFFYSKLRNMSGKLKKKIFMKPNNLFKFFVKFFYSIKNIYFPDILQHFKQKKIFLYISKKKSSLDASIFAKKFCSIIAILKKNFILNCIIRWENLKKKFSWSQITYLNFLWNFFTQLKIYIFPIYYSILNKKKTFYIFRKKNRAAMLRYSRKNFVQ